MARFVLKLILCLLIALAAGLLLSVQLAAADEQTKGKLSGDQKAFRAALMKAPERAKTPRGQWKEASNGTPIQDYYVRALVKDREGRIVNRKIGTILKDHRDFWLKDCAMK